MFSIFVNLNMLLMLNKKMTNLFNFKLINALLKATHISAPQQKRDCGGSKY